MAVFAVINVIHSRGQLHVDTVRVVARAWPWSGSKGSSAALIIRPPVAHACARLKQLSWFESRHFSVVCLEYLKKGDPTIVEMGRMGDGMIKCHYATAAAAASLGGRKRRH